VATGGRRGGREGTAIVFGLMFDLPFAGIVLQFLQYLIGLRRLGWDVWYVEDSRAWPYDAPGRNAAVGAEQSVRSVAPVLERHGFADRWVYRSIFATSECFGAGEAALRRLYREADVALNVTGAQEMRDEHASIPLLVYVQSDPFGMQVEATNGRPRARQQLDAHHCHFTFGELVGTPQCLVPDAGVLWQPTRQPVVLDLWEGGRPGASYTTVTTWHNSSKDVVWQGDLYYWTKDREFLAVMELPTCTRAPLELAVDGLPPEADDLRRHGWGLVRSHGLVVDSEAYRRYILGSRGEFTVARDQYVRPRTGWFSDRSACYLAAGKPVVTQDTGFDQVLPTGAGLLPYTDTATAAAALDAVEDDYEHHARAAREVAEEHFAAERVLQDLLRRAGP
jgi:hypothetical protein